jgi:hypothetical protein
MKAVFMTKGVLWSGVSLLLIGLAAYWYAASVASLSMVQCHNDYSLSAGEWQCRQVFYYAWGGIGLVSVGAGLLFVALLSRWWSWRAGQSR